eukprot:m.180886 g.180886  ORF g.180886 m.180886 type:complete len:387 (+) comp16620_c2_seq2:60-1220(+)
MQSVSQSIEATDAPCIVKMQSIVRGAEDILSLAQGVTYWSPPQSALDTARDLVCSSTTSAYGAVEGDADFVAALKRKLCSENQLEDCSVMVTAGANQAFMNIVLTLCDAHAEVVLFKPYYFNHLMALQMTGCNISFCPRAADTFAPDLAWLQENLPGKTMLVLVNPCNPSGTVTKKETLEAISELCTKHGVWFVIDNTYEYFVYNDAQHHCVGGPHVLNIFSFSKAYGLMGWRLGYIAWQNPILSPQLLKAQDTVVICPSRLSQRVGLAALQEGRAWCLERIQSLTKNRDIALSAIEEYDETAIVGSSDGAIYTMVKLPFEEDELIAEWLAHQHHVAVIPGSACGFPGHVRVAYANLSAEQCHEAVQRLKSGLQELRTVGKDAFLK